MREEWAGLPLSLGRAWLRKKFVAEIVTPQESGEHGGKKKQRKCMPESFA